MSSRNHRPLGRRFFAPEAENSSPLHARVQGPPPAAPLGRDGIMNQTENYQLSLWDPEDRIQRTDFNADNAKIEAALAGKLGPREIIKTVTLPIATTFNLDVSDIDWDQWDQVGFTLNLLTVGNAEPAEILCQAQTSVSGAKQYCSVDNLYFSKTAYMPFQMTFFPYHDAARKVEGLCIGKYVSVGFVECQFSQLTSLQFISSNNRFFDNSQSITLWGIR